MKPGWIVEQGAKSTLEAKRKRWLDRSGSLRLGKTKSLNPAVSNSSSNASNLTQANYATSSPWSSPESERRSFHIRNRSVDRALDEDDPGKVKGFVNRYISIIRNLDVWTTSGMKMLRPCWLGQVNLKKFQPRARGQ